MTKPETGSGMPLGCLNKQAKDFKLYSKNESHITVII